MKVMQVAVNDKKIALHFNDPREAITELIKLNSGVDYFINDNGRVLKITDVKSYVISVIIESDAKEV